MILDYSDYSDNRCQRVHIKEYLTDELIVECGVPQWSTLGLLIFTTYIKQS